MYSRFKLSEHHKAYLKTYIIKNDWSDRVLNISEQDSTEEIANKLKEAFEVDSIIVLSQNDKGSTVYISHMQKSKIFISSLSQSYAGKRDRISNIALIEYLNLLRQDS
ncbi:hypothetical protein [Mammaliicoccus vitulinus]|uniref:hypothetical protein n=1 Tax=Mammaliicoccus vitulinus TaxID=71237 RepID=UPI003F967D5B